MTAAIAIALTIALTVTCATWAGTTMYAVNAELQNRQTGYVRKTFMLLVLAVTVAAAAGLVICSFIYTRSLI